MIGLDPLPRHLDRAWRKTCDSSHDIVQAEQRLTVGALDSPQRNLVETRMLSVKLNIDKFIFEQLTQTQRSHLLSL